jgi:hypothetical protein
MLSSDEIAAKAEALFDFIYSQVLSGSLQSGIDSTA